MASEVAVTKTIELAGNVAATDMSILGLIAGADIIVKAVILLLILASFWSWAIIFDKFITLKKLNEKTDKFEKLFWSGQLLEQLYERLKGRTDHPIANLFIAAMHEWTRTNISMIANDAYRLHGLKERIAQAMDLTISREVGKLEKNLNFLAMVGSNAPFIGLFGTVWGIMHSFQSIAASKNTTLAVVAPGIAEALLATAIGLIAAIPATMFYNLLATKLNNFDNRLQDFSNELAALLSREIDTEVK